MSNVLFTFLSAAFFMGLVALYSSYKTKGSIGDSEGYFLAGRGLTGGFIAGSLILTNISAEQLVGLSGQAYGFNLSNMAWEVTAGVAVIVLAVILLPRYLGGAFTTLPEFIKSRYDQGTRMYIVILFMLGYAFVTIPAVLFSGSIAVLQLFDVPEMLGISFEQAMWLVIWTIGLIGAAYAIFGGLKAVAISDTINGIGLLAIGLLVPILALISLGNGNFLSGVEQLTLNNTEKLNSIGSADDGVPFGTIFSGMIFANLFYWSTNQYVIQRTLGAKNLAEGQKGALFTGFLKLLIPFIVMVPGTIAYQLYGSDLANIDLAYPTLINDLLPTFLSGFFLAALMGAVLSSFNSLLNSAATMFIYDIYKVLINENPSDKKMIRISQWFGTGLALTTFFISPLLLNAPDGIWMIIRRFTGFFNVPIIAVVLVGIFSKFVPPIAAKIAIVNHVIVYFMLMWGLPWMGVTIPIHFIHIQGLLFVLAVLIMLTIGQFKPLAEPHKYVPNARVEMVPWKLTIPTSILLFSLMVVSYIIFSPIGVAYENGIVSPMFWPVILALTAVTIILYYIGYKVWSVKYENMLYNVHEKQIEENIDLLQEEPVRS